MEEKAYITALGKVSCACLISRTFRTGWRP